MLIVNDLHGQGTSANRTGRTSAITRRVARDAAACAAAVGVLFESAESTRTLTLEAIWEAIDSVVLPLGLRAALESLAARCRPPRQTRWRRWRALLVERYAVVR